MDCIQGFWFDPRDPLDLPFAYQFWFIRDLMVLVLLTPFVRWWVVKLRGTGLVVLAALWFLGLKQHYIPGLGTLSVFFFTLGAYFSINRCNLVEKSGKWFILSLVLYPVLACLDLFTKEYFWNQYIHRTGILVGIFFVINLSAWLIQKKNIRMSIFFSEASFFVFAVHGVLLAVTQKILYLFIRPENGWILLLVYFLAVFLTVGIALVLYKFLRHCLPRFTSVIMGGR